MRTLKNYLNENIETELSDYIMIDEGLMRWFKRMWRKLFNSVEKNKKDHNGYYAPYKYVKYYVAQNDDEITQNNGDYKNADYKNELPEFKCEKMDKNTLRNFIKPLKTEDNLNPFFSALEYLQKQNNNNLIYLLTTISKNDKTDYLCIISGEKTDECFVIDKVFWNECIAKQYGISHQFTKSLFENVLRTKIGKELKIEEENIGPVEKFSKD